MPVKPLQDGELGFVAAQQLDRFRREPAELIADRPIFSFGCSLTFTRVAMATPTG
jgi:hypothetical protein